MKSCCVCCITMLDVLFIPIAAKLYMFDYLICTRHFLHAANYLSFAYFLSYYFTLFNKPIYVKKINEWWREMYKIVTESY